LNDELCARLSECTMQNFLLLRSDGAALVGSAAD